MLVLGFYFLLQFYQCCIELNFFISGFISPLLTLQFLSPVLSVLYRTQTLYFQVYQSTIDSQILFSSSISKLLAPQIVFSSFISLILALHVFFSNFISVILTKKTFILILSVYCWQPMCLSPILSVRCWENFFFLKKFIISVLNLKFFISPISALDRAMYVLEIS